MTTEQEQEKLSRASVYEIGYLLVPTISEEEVPKEVTAIKDSLEKAGYSLVSEEFPKFKPLAYPMRKRTAGAWVNFSNAYFGWVKFELDSASVKAIENAMKTNEQVLRFILIKTVRENTMSQNRAPREFNKERKEIPKEAAPSAPVSETELEKSIEKLIAE